MPRLAPVTSATAPESSFCLGDTAFAVLIPAIRILPPPGHSFCAKLILSSGFFAVLGIPGSCEGNRRESAGGTENYPQVGTSVFGNGLRMQGGIPYNPKVFRNNEIPGEALRGAPQKKT
jgi:hypothetical protein